MLRRYKQEGHCFESESFKKKRKIFSNVPDIMALWSAIIQKEGTVKNKGFF